jgi:hypothetical protein
MTAEVKIYEIVGWLLLYLYTSLALKGWRSLELLRHSERTNVHHRLKGGIPENLLLWKTII